MPVAYAPAKQSEDDMIQDRSRTSLHSIFVRVSHVCLAYSRRCFAHFA